MSDASHFEADSMLTQIEPADDAVKLENDAHSIRSTDPGQSEIPHRERRGHRRSKIFGSVQLSPVGGGDSVAARLEILSLGGCLLECRTELPYDIGASFTVTITRGSESAQAEGRLIYMLGRKSVGLVFTRTDPQHAQLLSAWVVESSWLVSDRRRSQRLFLDVPVTVVGKHAGGGSFSERTRTIKVSAEGCSVLLASPIGKGEAATLFNEKTKAILECVVVRLEDPEGSSDGRREVALAFQLPNRQFWNIYFPPLGPAPQAANR